MREQLEEGSKYSSHAKGHSVKVRDVQWLKNEKFETVIENTFLGEAQVGFGRVMQVTHSEAGPKETAHRWTAC